MKTKSRSSFGKHYNWWKIAALSMVVLASVYFIWQYVFVKNATGSKAASGGQLCLTSTVCPTGFKCIRRDSSWGTCEPKEKVAGRLSEENIRCDCNSQFGSCNNGYKIRLCTFNLSGKDKCNYAAAGGSVIQAVACNN